MNQETQLTREPLTASSQAHSPRLASQEPSVTSVSACKVVLQGEWTGQSPTEVGTQLSIAARNVLQRDPKSSWRASASCMALSRSSHTSELH